MKVLIKFYWFFEKDVVWGGGVKGRERTTFPSFVDAVFAYLHVLSPLLILCCLLGCKNSENIFFDISMWRRRMNMYVYV